MYLSLHCHHQNDSCITMGSDESHFNVSLIVRDKVITQCPQTTTFEEKRELKRNRTEALLLTSLTALPLGQAGSRPVADDDRMMKGACCNVHRPLRHETYYGTKLSPSADCVDGSIRFTLHRNQNGYVRHSQTRIGYLDTHTAPELYRWLLQVRLKGGSCSVHDPCVMGTCY